MLGYGANLDNFSKTIIVHAPRAQPTITIPNPPSPIPYKKET